VSAELENRVDTGNAGNAGSAGAVANGVKELLKPSDIAPLLGVTTARVYQLIQQGHLPGVRVGGAVRIPRSAWTQWLARLDDEAMAKVRVAVHSTIRVARRVKKAV